MIIMKDNIEKSLLDSAKCIEDAVALSEIIEYAIREIINCLENGKKILIFRDRIFREFHFHEKILKIREIAFSIADI